MGAGVDALLDFASDLRERLDAEALSGDKKGYMVLTAGQSIYLSKVRDGLIGLKQAKPEKFVLGSNPVVEVSGEGLRKAAEASQRLRSDILTARLAFSLGEEFRLEVSEGEIWIQR